MSLICELSGESISISGSSSQGSEAPTTIVVTPSGHVCRKNLLLQKLSENGGIDPFEPNQHRSLNEDDLIVLKRLSTNVISSNGSSSNSANNNIIIPPPRNFMNNHMSYTIQQIQMEYDNLLLELYDVKQLLQTTQQELSNALYQNDAAIRVVARISSERDVALQQLHHWNATSSSSTGSTANMTIGTNGTTHFVEAPLAESFTPAAATTSTTTVNETERNGGNDGDDGPQSKKMKLSSTTTIISSHQIPDVDYQCMMQTWETLHESRKARQKVALSRANTIDFVTLTATQTNNRQHYIGQPDESSILKMMKKKTNPTNTVVVYKTALELFTTISSSSSSSDVNTIQNDTLVQLFSASPTTVTTGDSHENKHQQCYTTICYDGVTKKETDRCKTNNLTVQYNTDQHCCFDSLPSVVSNDHFNNSNGFMVTAVQCLDNENNNQTFDHKIVLYRIQQETNTTTNSNFVAMGECTIHNNNNNARTSTMIIDIQLHPDQQHIIIATQNGNIYIIKYNSKSSSTEMNKDTNIGANKKYDLSVITQFTCPPELLVGTTEETNNNHSIYCTGTLHPDGLIYVTAVRTTGNLLLWDFKSQQLAATLVYPTITTVTDTTPTTVGREVSSMEFSNNGYHLAVAYKESGIIHIWDLRKQSILVTLNAIGIDGDDRLDNVVSVKFDDSGKYLAYSGNIGNDLIVAITTVKKWDRTATFRCPNLEGSHGLLWSKNLRYIAASALQRNDKNETSPRVVFFDL